jgi:uncharacterized membrane protein (DUF2068 family)
VSATTAKRKAPSACVSSLTFWGATDLGTREVSHLLALSAAAYVSFARVPEPQASPRPKALLAIAVLKLLKATLLIALGAGALWLRQDGHGLSSLNSLVRQLRVDPDNHLIHRAIVKVSSIDAGRLEKIGVGTFIYAALFLTEGGGLLLRKRWAEYLTTFITASFIPFELYELAHSPSVLKAAGIVVNAAIVAYLVARLWREHAQGSSLGGLVG